MSSPLSKCDNVSSTFNQIYDLRRYYILISLYKRYMGPIVKILFYVFCLVINLIIYTNFTLTNVAYFK
jgi:hypothetical protein